MVLLHTYLWWRMVRSTTRPGRLRRRLTVLTVVLGLLPVAAILLRRTLPVDAAGPLDWVAYSWLGIAFYAFLALLVLEPVRLVVRLVTPEGAGEVVASGARRAPRSDDAAAQRQSGTAPGRGGRPEDDDVIARRLFLARGLAITAGTVALGTAGTGVYFANSAPVVQRVPISLRGLDPALDGFRIVTFSDAHLSATYGGRRFERVRGVVEQPGPPGGAVVGGPGGGG